MTYEDWKDAAAKYAEDELQLSDLFAADDPYFLVKVAAAGGGSADPAEAYESGEDPVDYVQRVFAEDFAAQESEVEDYDE